MIKIYWRKFISLWFPVDVEVTFGICTFGVKIQFTQLLFAIFHLYS